MTMTHAFVFAGVVRFHEESLVPHYASFPKMVFLPIISTNEDKNSLSTFPVSLLWKKLQTFFEKCAGSMSKEHETFSCTKTVVS